MITKVTLRQKAIKNNKQSLYLDLYPPIINSKTGKSTRREFLGLYIFDNPKTPFDKQHNIETKKIAEGIRQKRENIFNKPEIYSYQEKEILKQKEKQEQSFLDYLKNLSKKRKDNNRESWKIAIQYLEDFTKGNLKFQDLDTAHFEDFKNYLLSTKSKRSNKKILANNTALSYFNKIKAGLKQAFKDGYLSIDLNSKITPIKEQETRKEYLTIDELNLLVKTKFNNDIYKRAALFSALTGLRFSDIQKMTWSELDFIQDQGYFINFNQKKTKGVEVLPISDQAYYLLNGDENPKEMNQTTLVFENLKYSAFQNRELSKWIISAGITKKITFHCFRHTFATLQLFNGTDIYTVSKMLGHKDLKTTQVYTKIVDEAKRKAVNKIQLDF